MRSLFRIKIEEHEDVQEFAILEEPTDTNEHTEVDEPREVGEVPEVEGSLEVEGHHDIDEPTEVEVSRASTNIPAQRKIASEVEITTGAIKLRIDFNEISSNELRAMAMKASQILSSRSHHLPRELSYQAWVPSLLGIAQELFERILYFCEPEYSYSRTKGYSLQLIGGAEQEADRPAKRVRTNSGTASTSSARLPTIRFKYEGPFKVPSIRLVSKRFHQALVDEKLIKIPVNIKIDCTGIKNGEEITNFAHRLFPYRVLKFAHCINIEIRCSWQQWHEMSSTFCAALRQVHPTAKVIVRVYLTYPRAEEEQALIGLIASCPWLKADGRQALAGNWFATHAMGISKEFEALGRVRGVEQIQLLHIDAQAGKYEFEDNYEMYRIESVHIMDKASGSNDLKMSNIYSFRKYFEIQSPRILDL